MLKIFDAFRELSTSALYLRLILAFVCGGLVGMEREYKRRPAGFRTHILICMGAAMTTLTSQYLSMELHYATDIARLGAQVIAGIGFIGAGTIIVTRRQRIKGLTTAAGLWATAIIGLSLGAGFYEGGVIATLLILAVELLMSKMEHFARSKSPEVNIYVEYLDRSCLERIIQFMHSNDIHVLNTEVMRAAGSRLNSGSAIFLLRLPKNIPSDQIVGRLNEIDGVLYAEEL